MVKCEVCRKTLGAAIAVKCSICSASYHRGCANLPECGTISSRWLCFGCKDKLTPSENHSPDTVERVFRKDLSIDLGLEIRCFREELSALRCEVRAYHDEIAEFKSILSTYKVAIDAMDVRLATLENKSDDDSIQEAIVDLECQINERHQEVLVNDVEIVGVPENIGENVLQLVKLVSEKLGVKVDEREVVHAVRVGSIPHNQMGGGLSTVTTKAPRPRHIAVSFTRRITREQLLQAARMHRGFSSADMGVTGPQSNVYINERLTPHNKWMFYLARKSGNEHKWNYIWTKNGKIFARKASGEQAVRIRRIRDLAKVFTPVTH